MIIPITPINKKPVPLPAKNGNGKKVFLLNRFFSGSIAKNGIVVTIIIKNTRCHNLAPAVTKDFMKPFSLSPSLGSRIMEIVMPTTNPIRKSLRLSSMISTRIWLEFISK